ncbi:3'-5' exonuclease [Sessilibacter corallicola]|uniref:Exonuclease domain-containing protein n=1 Tax=Sessilibacter corallicola TaxID=2904075 RepID=A0ABQ0A3T8_9GAMM|nr:exonuclease domain-containing protein [Sessilibacter corallicola]MCE2027072.1 hypothetical protein [Sessilibacter corallicola]
MSILRTAKGFAVDRHQRPPIVDVEASGFGSDSYPIEIGVVLNTGQRFSYLIKPFNDWTHWDDDAEALHGISREQLMTEGREPVEVAQELNAVLLGQTLYSDAWVVDKPWVDTLFNRAQIRRQFFVSPIEAITSEKQLEDWSYAKKRLSEELGQKIHRALNDALLIQETFVATQNSYSY